MFAIVESRGCRTLGCAYWRFEMSILFLVACASLAWQPPGSDEPAFTFVQSQLTGKHIAVQPMTDYHRVYTVIRVRNCEGKRVYGRVRCQPSDADPEKASTMIFSTEFSIASNNEIWKLYFRVPRFASKTATFQLEFGEIEPLEVNDHVLRTSFGWRVDRDNPGPARFVHDLGSGNVVSMTTRLKIAIIEGGEIKIRYAYGAPAPETVALEYGFTSQGAMSSVDGDVLAERVED
jgi:hypothetical protein